MSRELDTQVAEKVMGWGGPPSPTFGLMESPSDGPMHPPEYSSSISDAWKVVEKVFHPGGHIGMSPDGIWTVTLVVPGRAGEWRNVTAWAKSAPEAVCLAALKALEKGDTK